VTESSIKCIQFLGQRQSWDEPLSEVCKRCAQALALHIEQRPDLFGSLRFYLFGFSGWGFPGAITRHRGLWNKDTPLKEAGIRFSDQIEMPFPSDSVRNKGMGFAGCMEFAAPALCSMLEKVRTGPFAVLLSSRDLCEASAVREFYDLAFEGNKGCLTINWKRLIGTACLQDSFVARALGGFDDPDVAVHVFFR